MRVVKENARFSAAVREGIAQADRGELIDGVMNILQASKVKPFDPGPATPASTEPDAPAPAPAMPQYPQTAESEQTLPETPPESPTPRPWPE